METLNSSVSQEELPAVMEPVSRVDLEAQL